MTEERELHQLLLQIYDRRQDEIRVSPNWLATAAMEEMDPDRSSPTIVYTAAHLELRQLARSILRKAADPIDEASDQHEMFPLLQKRYPAARSTTTEEPEYVKLEALTELDVAFNLGRMRASASRLLAHCDALEAWWTSRQQAA
jgi:hypothetical protein